MGHVDEKTKKGEQQNGRYALDGTAKDEIHRRARRQQRKGGK